MQVVAIANDVTYNSAPLGPKGNTAAHAATYYALHREIPVMIVRC